MTGKNMTKTPNFDKKIGEILKDLKPHKRVCRISGEEFDVTKQDLEFYKKMKVPPPTLSPKMRYLRKAMNRNERNLFNRNCDLTGKKILSIFRPTSRFKVYSLDSWSWGSVDAMQYGQDYDESRSFFDQFMDLKSKVPREAITGVKEGKTNCSYTAGVAWSKNCFMCFLGGWSENCLYNTWFIRVKDSVDIFHLNDSELCYECAY